MSDDDQADDSPSRKQFHMFLAVAWAAVAKQCCDEMIKATNYNERSAAENFAQRATFRACEQYVIAQGPKP